jgi:hypothetical protein
VKDSPTGIELIAAAVHDADAAKAKITQLNEALRAAEQELLMADARLASLVASGACTAENGCTRDHTVKQPPPASAILGDTTIPKIWRIALMLLADPVLNYQKTALQLWGPSDFKTAKNRVNGHMTYLRKLGVVQTLGSNRFLVDRANLVEKSGLAEGYFQVDAKSSD